MPGFASPDVPAYYAYALVLILGIGVAVQTVNNRLASHRDRWAFAGTWWLFLTHVAVPVLLFWFLDYTSALHDTSLFAALLVAFGYRQIFAGGIQGIRIPDQAFALWKPFDAWVGQVVDRIATRNKLYLDRFDDKVRSLIVGDDKRMDSFTSLALSRSKDPTALRARLDGFQSTGDHDADKRRTLDIMWRDFRSAEPDLYGWLLYKRGIVQGWRYWMWLKHGRSQLISAGVVLGALAMVGVLFWSFTSFPEGSDRRHSASIQYHQWRFLKLSTTERDRWRSREYLAGKLAGLAVRRVKAVDEARADADRAWRALDKLKEELKRLKPDAPERSALQAKLDTADKVWTQAYEEQRRSLDAQALLTPLLKELRFPAIPTNRAAEILALLVNAHAPALNPVWVPELIESIRAQNEMVRLETRKALVALQKADYATVPLAGELEKWEPKKDESVGDVDQRVHGFREWWQKVLTAYPPVATAG